MMDSEVFTPLLEDFMLTPLVSWVKTVVHPTTSDGSKLSEYIALVDGIYLNEIMLEINPTATVQRTNKKVNNDPSLRIQNLSILIGQIKAYYQPVSASCFEPRPQQHKTVLSTPLSPASSVAPGPPQKSPGGSVVK